MFVELCLLNYFLSCSDVWIQKYCRYLQSRRGKSKAARNAEQHGKQVLSVMRAMGGLTINILRDLERGEAWIESELKSKQPGTVMSYCHSVAIFFDYIAETGQVGAFERPVTLPEIQQCASNWRKMAQSLQRDKMRAQIEISERGFSKSNIIIKCRADRHICIKGDIQFRNI